jgi:hypothetical protein
VDAKRVLEIILEEAGRVDERYDGYRAELTETVAEIVSIERAHKVISRNVKQDIAGQVNRLGSELADHLKTEKAK